MTRYRIANVRDPAVQLTVIGSNSGSHNAATRCESAPALCFLPIVDG